MSNHWLTLLQKYRAIAVIRSSNSELALHQAIAVAAGGIRMIEITWNSDGAADLISQLRSELPKCIIGTGTILNIQQMRQAIAAEAEYVFTPHVDVAMLQEAVKLNIPMIPGALSPTEIITAWQAGASCVKVFPIGAVGGVNYIKSLQGPLGQIPLIPTGGVTLENAAEFLTSGAIAVGISGSLFPQSLIVNRDWAAIQKLAQTLVESIQ